MAVVVTAIDAEVLKSEPTFGATITGCPPAVHSAGIDLGGETALMTSRDGDSFTFEMSAGFQGLADGTKTTAEFWFRPEDYVA